MLVPPQLGTQERRNHDLDLLRIYYLICEDIELVDHENVKKSFQYLMGWAGSFKFNEEFVVFKTHIDRLRESQK